MALPTTTYDTATILNPAAALTNFSLMVDLSRMSAAWWAAAENTNARRGRAAKDDGTELPCDWVAYDHASQTGWLRVNWSGTLAGSGTQVLRVYPPVAANSDYTNGSTYGKNNAYDTDWIWYGPGGSLANQLDATQEMVRITGWPGALSSVGVTTGSIYYDGVGSRGDLQASYQHPSDLISDYPVTIMSWSNCPNWDERGTQMSLLVGASDNPGVYPRLQHGSFGGVGGALRSEYNDTLANQARVNTSSGYLVNDQWHHFATRMTASAIENYIDADSAGGGSDSHSILFEAGCDSVTINPQYVGQLGYTCEHQVHTADRSLAWIQQEKDQVNDQAAFWGTWTNVPAATGDTPPARIPTKKKLLLLLNRKSRGIFS